MGNNLLHDGLKEVTKAIEDSGKKKPSTPHEIAGEWNRLAAAFSKG